MVACLHCGADNRPQRRFCGRCGGSLARVCAHCGFGNDPQDAFCGGCGVALDEGPHSAVAAAADIRPEAVQRRQITVLFCDLAGSTALAARVDAEELSAIHRDYQELCTAAVEDHGGHLARYMGDGVLCYFGYPVAHEDDAVRAVDCALEIRDAMIEGNRRGRWPGGERLQVRLGIATGRVIVGEVVGEGAARESTAVGQTPNLAARIQALAEPDAVLVSDETRRLLGRAFQCRDLGHHQLKGIEGPVRVWRIDGRAEVDSRFEASRPDRLAPLVGRDLEIGLLTQCWQRARGSEGRVVMLSGEPGIGKSRLVHTLRTRIAAGEPSMLAQCSPQHRSSALHPIAELIRRWAGAAGDGIDADTLAELLGRHDLHDIDRLAALARLLSLPSPAADSGLDARSAKRLMLSTIVELFAAAARKRPLAIVFEDIHWADPTTLELLDRVVATLHDKPILALLTFRPEFEPPWTGQPHVQLLALSRLSPRSSREIANAVAGADLPDEMLAQIADRTDGVPLFVEEVTRALVERRGGAGDGDGFDIPATLQDSLTARLDSLGDALVVARAGSVVGREFGIDIVAAALGATPASIAAAVERLVDSGLVLQLGADDDVRYQFKHALIQDAAHAGLLREQRRILNARVARHLEAAAPGIEDRQPELLAHHYSEAGQWDRALDCWRRAGRVAEAASAIIEASDHYRRALDAFGRLDESGRERATELGLRLALAGCWRMMDRYDDAVAELERAEAIAADHGDHDALADVHHLRGNISFPTGRLDDCLKHHRLALDHARAAHSPDKEARAIGGLGDAYYLGGRMRTAAEHFRRCCRLSEEHGFEAINAANRPMVGWSRIFLFELREAVEDGLRAVEIADHARHPRAGMMANALLAFVYNSLGDHERAAAHGETSIRQARKFGAGNFEAAALLFTWYRPPGPELTGRSREMLMLAADKSVRFGVDFHGASIAGALAELAADRREAASFLARGEELLQRSCVSHNRFHFYRSAIEVSLRHRQWEEADRYAAALEAFGADETLQWSTFFAGRGRALARFGRGRRDEALRDELERHRDAALRVGLGREARAIDEALAAF